MQWCGSLLCQVYIGVHAVCSVECLIPQYTLHTHQYRLDAACCHTTA